jgi:hypothetical protein
MLEFGLLGKLDGVSPTQEIEITALRRLVYVFEIKPAISSLEEQVRGAPIRPPLGQLGLVYVEVQPAPGDVQFNLVTILNERKGSAHSAFWGHVQHNGAKGGSAHSPIGDAHHVPDTPLQELTRNGEVSHLRHTRPANRSYTLQHQYIVLYHIQLRAVDSRAQVSRIPEDKSPSPMVKEPGRGSGMFDHSAIRRQIASQYGQSPLEL